VLKLIVMTAFEVLLWQPLIFSLTH